jgi:hypothetical protein
VARICAGTSTSQEQNGEDGGAEQVAEMQGHREGIAAGLAQGGGGDLDDPEAQGDLGDFAGGGWPVGIHAKRSPSAAVGPEGERQAGAVPSSSLHCVAQAGLRAHSTA